MAYHLYYHHYLIIILIIFLVNFCHWYVNHFFKFSSYSFKTNHNFDFLYSLFRNNVKFRHPQVNNAPFENDDKCSRFIINNNIINDTHLNKAFIEALSIHDRIKNLEHDLDLKHVDTINTTTITSLARHIIPAKHQHEILDLHHEQRPYEEASKIIAKKLVKKKNQSFVIY